MRVQTYSVDGIAHLTNATKLDHPHYRNWSFQPGDFVYDSWSKSPIGIVLWCCESETWRDGDIGVLWSGGRGWDTQWSTRNEE